MARRLGLKVSKTAGLVGCYVTVVYSGQHLLPQKWSKERQPVKRQQGCGRTTHIDERREQWCAFVVQSYRRDTIVEIAVKANAGSKRKVSEHTALQVAAYGAT